MTIVLIAVAGLLLAGMARQSLSLAVEARDAQEDLQRRWGVLSCQRAILSQARNILKEKCEAEQESNAAFSKEMANTSAQVILGGLQFDLLLSDEGAKISLNSIYHRQGNEAVSRLVQEIASPETPPIRLRPYNVELGKTEIPAFDSWGQVFAAKRTEDNRPLAESLAAATTRVTCWGDGRLNMEYAPDDAVEQVGRLAITDRSVRLLLSARREYFAKRKEVAKKSATIASSAEPKRRWLSSAIDSLSLRLSERSELERLLTDRSTCHSLWITIRDKERSWHSFCVADVSERTMEKGWSYSW